MSHHVCPRCGSVFSDWQTVHVACVLRRVYMPLLKLADTLWDGLRTRIRRYTDN